MLSLFFNDATISLQQTNLSPLESSSFQCHHHTGLCTTSGHDDNDVERDAQADWGDYMDPTAMLRQMGEVSDF